MLALSILDEYIDAGAFFFAAKVRLEAISAEDTWLSPLQFSYKSEIFSLPIRIGTISSPGVQDVLIYTITDVDAGEVRIANYPEVALEDECMWRSDEEFSAFYGQQFTQATLDVGGAGWAVEYSWAASNCDPCSSDPLSSTELQLLGFRGGSDAHFTRLHVQYTPEAADQDLILYTTNMSPTEQIRYIDYGTDLEEMFPICGEGWAPEPGSCSDEDETPSGCSVYVRRQQRTLGLGLLGLFGLAIVLQRRRSTSP